MKPEMLARAAAEHLEQLRPRLSEALANLECWAGIGYGSGGSNGRSGGTSDPTQRMALNTLERPVRDQFASDHAALVASLQTAELALRKAEQIVDRSRALPNGSVSTPEGCWPCSQVKDPTSGKGHENGFQAIYVRKPIVDAGPKIGLCSFHSEWLERYDQLPTGPIDLWHLEHPGTRVPQQMIKDQMPEAWSIAQSRAADRALGRSKLGLRASA